MSDPHMFHVPKFSDVVHTSLHAQDVWTYQLPMCPREGRLRESVSIFSSFLNLWDFSTYLVLIGCSTFFFFKWAWVLCTGYLRCKWFHGLAKPEEHRGETMPQYGKCFQMPSEHLRDNLGLLLTRYVIWDTLDSWPEKQYSLLYLQQCMIA